jgi:PhnB protein
MSVKPIPDGHSTVIPYLFIQRAAELIAFLIAAFDAREMYRSTMPDGRVMHAHLRIGDSSIMLGEAPADRAGAPAMLYMYVEDVDAVYKRAIHAGATPMNEPADQFYGDRVGAVKDFAGNQWWIGTRKEDVPEDELARRAAAARAKGCAE